MPVRLFTDIDDTLMSTARKVPPELRAAVGAIDREGSPSSYMTGKQVELWSRIAGAADSVVPVSARSAAALVRLKLDMVHGAIVDFGATVLNADGSLDTQWLEQQQAAAAKRYDAELFALLHAEMQALAAAGKVEQRVTNGLQAFINFRGAPGSAAQARELVEAVLEEQGVRDAYYLHITDRDVTVLPTCVSKGSAVDYFVTRHGWAADLLIGAGDSLSDCSFLAGMDYALVPRASRAFAALNQVAANRGELP